MRAVESMLLVAPDPTSRLGDLIGPVGLIKAVDSNGLSTELYGVFPIQPMPECLSASSATAINAVLEGPLPPQSIRIDLWALNGQSRCLYRSIQIPLVDEVSFKNKGHLPMVRDADREFLVILYI